MALLDYINPFAFFIAFAIGLFYQFMITPEPEVVTKYPSPYDSDDIKYTDKSGMCFKYRVTKSACPQDGGMIKSAI
jgi:hypothetical protein